MDPVVHFELPYDNRERGKWRRDGGDDALLQITANGTTTAYRIVELSKKLLRLRPLEPNPKK
jgi:hypothetical protein